ncbi:hypothetical protein HS088_TW03G00572 [Tripterygium wilfordii]|uniref:Mitochondrial glycoprotein family protein n=1 Tax=Tripterygium wilfordii TaxID=458696 RepID=A0A7J7DVB6_TRIWF|nr:mitochondrial acidic protein MAM33 [Tripterygium wilfordii]KAF5750239.1 hypothetical protein HS088_TW03G00572 [Tripterygium wilfordii]
MSRATPILSKARKTLQDLELLKVLQSEINHELSSTPVQTSQSGSLGDFVVDWDSPGSLDVVLRRKYESGEEVAVSALLGPVRLAEVGDFPSDAFMKVCIKKPGLSSILQFDCGVFGKGGNVSEFDVHNAYYLKSVACPSPSVYRGPLYSTLDPQLQDTLKEYLETKGIGKNLTSFLLHYLHRKEQGQYVNWLQKLEAFVAKED